MNNIKQTGGAILRKHELTNLSQSYMDTLSQAAKTRKQRITFDSVARTLLTTTAMSGRQKDVVGEGAWKGARVEHLHGDHDHGVALLSDYEEKTVYHDLRKM